MDVAFDDPKVEIENWSLEESVPEGFAMSVYEGTTSYDGGSKAIGIMETKENRYATIRYTPGLALTAWSYI